MRTIEKSLTRTIAQVISGLPTLFSFPERAWRTAIPSSINGNLEGQGLLAEIALNLSGNSSIDLIMPGCSDPEVTVNHHVRAGDINARRGTCTD